MSVFKVDFDKLILLLLPTPLRQLRIYAFLQTAIAPLKEIYYSFLTTKEETDFLLKYNTSKRNVEIALWTRFNDIGIYIQSAQAKVGISLPFFLPAHLETSGFVRDIEMSVLPTQLPFYINPETPTSDFTIYVPETTYIVHAQEIYDIASFFVLPGFRYDVKRF